mmetsp:Transcript_70094/g.196151  ORF Transcript_70094/g.196151 Transcript_70094/m.196151 type:complete len:245 (-) Transcript_70094:324-1058(-)
MGPAPRPRGGFLIFGAGPPAPRGPGGALRPRPMPPCGRMLFMPMGGPWFLGRACSCFFCAGSFFFLVFTGFASAHSSSCWCVAPSSHSDAMHCWILSSLLPHFLSTERISPSLIPLGNKGFHCSGGGDGRPRRGHEVSEVCGKQHMWRELLAPRKERTAPLWRGRQYEGRRVQLVASSEPSRRVASVPIRPAPRRAGRVPGARARRGAMAPEPKGTPPGARLAGHRRVQRTTTARGPRSSIRTS